MEGRGWVPGAGSFVIGGGGGGLDIDGALADLLGGVQPGDFGTVAPEDIMRSLFLRAMAGGVAPGAVPGGTMPVGLQALLGGGLAPGAGEALSALLERAFEDDGPPVDARRPDRLVCPTCMTVHRPVEGSESIEIPKGRAEGEGAEGDSLFSEALPVVTEALPVSIFGSPMPSLEGLDDIGRVNDSEVSGNNSLESMPPLSSESQSSRGDDSLDSFPRIQNRGGIGASDVGSLHDEGGDNTDVDTGNDTDTPPASPSRSGTDVEEDDDVVFVGEDVAANAINLATFTRAMNGDDVALDEFRAAYGFDPSAYGFDPSNRNEASSGNDDASTPSLERIEGANGGDEPLLHLRGGNRGSGGDASDASSEDSSMPSLERVGGDGEEEAGNVADLDSESSEDSSMPPLLEDRDESSSNSSSDGSSMPELEAIGDGRNVATSTREAANEAVEVSQSEDASSDSDSASQNAAYVVPNSNRGNARGSGIVRDNASAPVQRSDLGGSPNNNDNDEQREASTNPLTHLRDYGALRAYAKASCPICLEECEPVVVLTCGHCVCEEDYERLGGYLASDKEKLKAEANALRSIPREAEMSAPTRDARENRDIPSSVTIQPQTQPNNDEFRTVWL